MSIHIPGSKVSQHIKERPKRTENIFRIFKRFIKPLQIEIQKSLFFLWFFISHVQNSLFSYGLCNFRMVLAGFVLVCTDQVTLALLKRKACLLLPCWASRSTYSLGGAVTRLRVRARPYVETGPRQRTIRQMTILSRCLEIPDIKNHIKNKDL